jgi:hypothetical protein
MCIPNVHPHELLSSPAGGVQNNFKGIFSRDFGTLFLISLDSFEGHYRAGSGLFFISMTFSCLNFKKLVLCGKDPLELMILELLLIGRFLILPV